MRLKTARNTRNGVAKLVWHEVILSFNCRHILSFNCRHVEMLGRYSIVFQTLYENIMSLLYQRIQCDTSLLAVTLD